jgi:hypothetical protein
MGQNWNVPRHDEVKKQFLEAWGRNLMRGLNQYVARISEREQIAGSELSYEIRGNMVIGARHQSKSDPVVIDALLQVSHGQANMGSRVFVEAG